ncbi:MAG: hypothetical protein OEZ16_02305 [Chromatiales bacterium]|nr:hypothetical protein [Chromatiales bacterium]
MKFRSLIVLLLALSPLLLTACQTTITEEVTIHSTDHSTDYDYTPLYNHSYSLASVHGLAQGEWMHFPLHGSDSYGHDWSGYITRQGLPGEWVNGTWTIPTMTEISLVHAASGGTLRRTATLYLDQYGHEVKKVLGNGVVCYPTTVNDIPSFALDGDYGNLASMNCSDGSEQVGIWDLFSNPDHSADFITLEESYTGIINTDYIEITQTLNTDGLILGYSINLFDPHYGVTIWLYSN